MPTTPVVDPDIAATSATSGTLRYSAFWPVIDVIESPKTTLSVSRNATGNSRAWTSVMGLRANRMSSRRVSTTVCDSRWRQRILRMGLGVNGRADKYRHQVLRR